MNNLLQVLKDGEGEEEHRREDAEKGSPGALSDCTTEVFLRGHPGHGWRGENTQNDIMQPNCEREETPK